MIRTVDRALSLASVVELLDFWKFRIAVRAGRNEKDDERRFSEHRGQRRRGAFRGLHLERLFRFRAFLIK